MEELNYPELPEGYVWNKRVEDKTYGTLVQREDVDIWQEGQEFEERGLVAWVTDRGGKGVFAKNRNTATSKHGKPTPVSSYQEGINLIHAQLMLGLIGVGKCLEEE